MRLPKNLTAQRDLNIPKPCEKRDKSIREEDPICPIQKPPQKPVLHNGQDISHQVNS